MKIIFFILFLFSFNFCSSQIIEFDTLMQDFRIPGFARTSNDTIIKKFPTADNFKFPQLIQEMQKRINPDNYFNEDGIGLVVLISKSGEIEKITVKTGHNNDCIEEAIRVVKSFNTWTPAIYEYYLKPKHKGKSTFIGDVSLAFVLQMKK